MNYKFRKFFSKTISSFIVMVMVVGSLPLSIFAGEPDEDQAQAAQAYDAQAQSDGQDDDQSDFQLIPNLLDILGLTDDADNDIVPVNGAVDTDPDEDPADVPDAKQAPDNGDVKAAPPDDDGTIGRLTITRNGTDFPSGTSYVMSQAEGKGFFVNYRYSSLENIVLVVECLDMGADFAAIPETNEFFNSVSKLGQGKLALRFNNSPNGNDCTINFLMKAVPLTNEQAFALMDSATVPTSRIAVTEYTLPEGTPLSKVLEEGTKGEEQVLWEGTPYSNPEATVTAPNPFALTVSPYSDETGSLTDFYFDAIGQSGRYFHTKFDGSKNGAYRFSMPSIYSENGSLIEVLGIRLYEPTSLVYLRALDLPGGEIINGNSPNCQFTRSYFDSYWDKWTIGERTYDADKDAYYYDLTPNERYLNIDSYGKTAVTAGMNLRWRLNDKTVPLAQDTTYLAPDTVITYRLPGDGSNVRTTEVKGSTIQTGKITYRDMQTTYTAARAADRTPVSDQDVIVGKSYNDQGFTNVFNSMSHTAKNTILPAYTGKVTQLYEFPYQIQPTKMHLVDTWRQTYNSNTMTSKISGIYYNSWDDDSWVAVDQSVIDSMNSRFHSNNGTYQSAYQAIGDVTFPADIHVKNIRIEWERLGTMMRTGEGANNNSSTVTATFYFNVNNWTDKTETATLPIKTQVQVRYSETYDGVYNNGEIYRPDTVNADMMLAGQDEPSQQAVEQYLWFRLVVPEEPDQICPDLYGIGTYDNVPYSIDGGRISGVGDLGITIGKYGERYDLIHNPKITLKLINLKNEIANATDEQLLALFTGKFTAMPKLSGWTFVYTAENSKHEKYTNSVTIPEITNNSGVEDTWLPLPEGYAFTSVVLSYDGEFDLSHKSETDTNNTIWLMKNILLKRYDNIPYLDKKIYVNKDYGYAEIRLNGSITFDITGLADENGPHCKCDGDIHVTGKDMVFSTAHSNFRVYNTRRATIGVTGKDPEKAVIYQGESVGDSSSENDATTWDKTNYAVFSGDAAIFNEAGEYGIDYGGAYRYVGTSKYTSYHKCFPIDGIREYLYIELTDEEFIPNLKNSTLWGYPLTDENVQSEIITANDADGNMHRFLKLHFSEGFIRTKVYQSNMPQGWRDKGILDLEPNSSYFDEGQNILRFGGRLYREDNLTGPFKLAFDTVPGTTPGEHHPVGMIYYDFADFLSYGHASVNQSDADKNGFDNDRTCYSFSGNNITDDTMGITGDTSRKLFYHDGSAWTVEVLMHQEVGANVAPGKNLTYYDFSAGNYRYMEFEESEKNNLNAFLTITGPGNLNASPIYDMSTIVVLPREGKKIEYTYATTVDGVQQDFVEYTEPSDFTLYMRGVPHIVSNNTSSDPVIMYTTDEDPNDASATWVDSGSVSDWKSVTGIRVALSVMEPTTSLNLRLDLATDAEITSEQIIKECVSGGSFIYRESQNGNFIDSQHLNLSRWNFHGYIYTCQVFWDIYDENGDFRSYDEKWIKGVPVTIYDAEGNPIPQSQETSTVYTDSNGKATLIIPKYEKGLYIVAGTPGTTDGSVAKMTAYPAGRFVSYDRTINKVVLQKPAISSGLFQNATIGFVKLPQIEAKDIEMYVGDTVSAEAIVKEFVSNATYNDNNILTNGTYKISFKGIDKSIATFENDGKLTQNDNNSLKSEYSFTGVSGGKFTVEAVASNSLGDTVSTTFNVIVRELEDLVVTNSWDDDNNRDGIRPDGVTVQLLKNGVEDGEPVTLNYDNKETFTWSKKVRFDDSGNEIEYTLKVTPIAKVPGHTGYTQTVDKSSYTANVTATAGGYKFTVKNVHIPEKVDLTVTKIWDDSNNCDKIRPATIKVELSDGTKVSLSESNKWTYTAKGRYKYEKGKEIKYSWKEVNVPDGYKLTVEEDGYKTTLINAHDPKVDVIVTNIWDDDNNRDGIRPDGVTVQLMKNGVAEGNPVVLKESNKNKYTWSNLPRLDENEKEIEYNLDVTPIADVPGHTGYTQTVDKSSYTLEVASNPRGYKFTVTNVHIPERVDRTVVAVWIDDNNIDGIRPENLTVGLSDCSTVTIDEKIEWTSTVDNLYKYAEGQLQDYSWIAPAVPEGYSFSQSVEGTVTTLTYVHTRDKKDPTPTPAKTTTPTPTPPGTRVPSTGERIATGSTLAAGIICISVGIAGIAAYCYRRKKEE